MSSPTLQHCELSRKVSKFPRSLGMVTRVPNASEQALPNTRFSLEDFTIRQVPRWDGAVTRRQTGPTVGSVTGDAAKVRNIQTPEWRVEWYQVDGDPGILSSHGKNVLPPMDEEPFSLSELHKFFHETCGRAIFGSKGTDVPLGNIRRTGGPGDVKTPDFIGGSRRNYCFLELSTMKVSIALPAKNIFDQAALKEDKYFSDLVAMIKQDEAWTLSAPVITRKYAYCAFALEDEVLESLSVACILAAHVESWLEANGLAPIKSKSTPGEAVINIYLKELMKMPASEMEKYIASFPKSIEHGGISRNLIDKIWEEPDEKAWEETRSELMKDAESRADSDYGSGFDSCFDKYQREVASLADESVKSSATCIAHIPVFDCPGRGRPAEPTDFDCEIREMGMIWRRAFGARREFPERWREMPADQVVGLALETAEEDDEVADLDERKRDADGNRIRKKFRTKIDFSSLGDYLAKRGVCVKGNREDIKKRRDLGKDSCFKLNADTRIIDTMMEDWSASLETEIGLTLDEELIDDLVFQSEAPGARGKHDRESYEYWRKMRSTKFHRRLNFVKQWARELAYDFNKPCHDTEFVLKEMGEGWILTKPMDKNLIHFSVCMPKHCTPVLGFERPASMGNFWVTEFTSRDPQKVSHMCCAFEKVFMMCEAFRTCFRVDPATIGKEFPDQLKRHCAISALIYLTNKAQLSETLSFFRYGYAEAIKGASIKRRNEAKILKKFPTTMRSLLTIWCVNGFLRSIDGMHKNGPKIVMDKDTRKNSSGDRISGCVSWVDGSELSSLEQILCVTTVGHAHNKEEGDETQGFLKIFQKIMSQELLLYSPGKEKVENYGFSSLPHNKLGNHEFNAEWVKQCGKRLFHDICKEHALSARSPNDPSWVQFFSDKVGKLYEQSTLDTVATFKSSFIGKPENVVYPGYAKKRTKANKQGFNERSKVIIQARELLEKGISALPMVDIERLIQLVTRGEPNVGLLCSLFKKHQIGGIREIFILTLEGRLSVLYVENISRALCELTGMEMLTKGGDKHARMMRWADEVKSNSQNSNVAHLTNSDDASTWCQRFVMSVFASLLGQLVPRAMFLTVCRVLELVYWKKLELPLKLLDTMIANPNVRSMTSNEINVLKDQFLGVDQSGTLVKPREVLLNNFSNMMQGILHYTSSLLHCGHLRLCEVLALDYLLKLFPGCPAAVISLVSSDDSTAGWAIFYKVENKRDIMRALRVCSCMKTISYPLICAGSSDEKSTKLAAAFMLEFNQIWMWMNTSQSAYMKACIAIMPSTGATLQSRVQQSYELAKGAIDFGGGIFLSRMMHLWMCHMHYENLNLSMPGAGPFCRQIIMDSKNPGLGFYPLPPALSSGLTNLDYEHARRLRDNATAQDYERAVRVADEHTYDDSLKKGFMLSIEFGGSKKRQELLRSMKIRDNWRDAACRNFRMLWSNSVTTEIAEYRIQAKAMSPGSRAALRWSDVKDPIVGSLYTLHRPCVMINRKMTRVEKVAALIRSGKTLAEAENISDGMTFIDKGDCGPQRVTGVTNKFEKVSLLKALSLINLKACAIRTKMNADLAERSEEKDNEEEARISQLTEALISDVCPTWQLVKQIESARDDFSMSVFIRDAKGEERPQRRVDISKKAILAASPVPLSQCLKYYWAGIQSIPYSRRLVESSFDRYKEGIPWLMQDVDSCIKNPECPFGDRAQLVQFALSLAEPHFSFHGISRCDAGQMTRSTFVSIISVDYMPGFTARANRSDGPVVDSVQNVEGAISSMIYAPFMSKTGQMKSIIGALKKMRIPQTGASPIAWSAFYGSLSPNQSKLAPIAFATQCLSRTVKTSLVRVSESAGEVGTIDASAMSREDKEKLMEMIQRPTGGSVGFFLEEQSKVGGIWMGKAVYKFQVESLVGEATLETDSMGFTTLTRLAVNKVHLLGERGALLRHHLMGVFGSFSCPPSNLENPQKNWWDPSSVGFKSNMLRSAGQWVPVYQSRGVVRFLPDRLLIKVMGGSVSDRKHLELEGSVSSRDSSRMASMIKFRAIDTPYNHSDFVIEDRGLAEAWFRRQTVETRDMEEWLATLMQDKTGAGTYMLTQLRNSYRCYLEHDISGLDFSRNTAPSIVASELKRAPAVFTPGVQWQGAGPNLSSVESKEWDDDEDNSELTKSAARDWNFQRGKELSSMCKKNAFFRAHSSSSMMALNAESLLVLPRPGGATVMGDNLRSLVGVFTSVTTPAVPRVLYTESGDEVKPPAGEGLLLRDEENEYDMLARRLEAEELDWS